MTTSTFNESFELTELTTERKVWLNEVILKALRIKTNQTKSQKYLTARSFLGMYGLELIDDDWSEQNYFQIYNPKTNRDLVISKDRNRKVALFNPYSIIVYNDSINKVDFVNYLATPRVKDKPSKRFPTYRDGS